MLVDAGSQGMQKNANKFDLKTRSISELFFSALFQSDKIKKVWEPEYVFAKKKCQIKPNENKVSLQRSTGRRYGSAGGSDLF